MQLSIWILKKWLESRGSWEMNSIITEGRQEIEGFRLFSGYSEVNTHFAYGGYMNQFFESAPDNQVLLMHRNDMIQIKNADFVEVINEVIECFEFFQNWNSQLMVAACSDTPEQDLVDLCRDVIGPVQLVDMKMNLVAFTQGYEQGQINSIWDYYIENRSISLKMLHSLKEDEFLKRYSRVNHMCIFQAQAASPYTFGLMDSLFDHQKKMIGQIIYAYKNEVTEADIHIARMVSFAFHSIRGRKWEDYSNDIASSILAEGIRKGRIDLEELNRLKVIHGIRPGESFRLYTFYNPGKTAEHLQASLTSRIRRELSDSIVFSYEKYVVICMALRGSQERNQQHLKKTGEELHMMIGVSYVLKNLSDISLYFQQTLDSLFLNNEKKQTFCEFRRVALYAMLHSENNEYCRCCIHPAIKEIRNHDQREKTELLATLHTYLRCGCSYLKASEALHVHRNTVLLRIQKIEELFSVDLEDPEEREYLLVSALI